MDMTTFDLRDLNTGSYSTCLPSRWVFGLYSIHLGLRDLRHGPVL
jgi:hypothetical protein